MHKIRVTKFHNTPKFVGLIISAQEENSEELTQLATISIMAKGLGESQIDIKVNDITYTEKYIRGITLITHIYHNAFNIMHLLEKSGHHYMTLSS